MIYDVYIRLAVFTLDSPETAAQLHVSPADFCILEKRHYFEKYLLLIISLDLWKLSNMINRRGWIFKIA